MSEERFLSVTEACYHFLHPTGKPKSRAYIHKLLSMQRFPNAKKAGELWIIPYSDIQHEQNRQSQAINKAQGDSHR
jgi:hypothetical protein